MLGSSQLAASAASVVRNKLLAVLLGPAGVGLFAQLQTLQMFISNVIPMGMNVGVLNYLAKNRTADSHLFAKYVSTASKVFFVLSLFTAAICLILVRRLADWTLDDPKLYLYLVPPLLGVPFLIQTQLWLTYLRAVMAMKQLALASLLTSVVGMAVVVPLVLIWRQWGATFHLLFIAIIGYAVAWTLASRSMDAETKTGIKAARLDFRVLWNLLRFSTSNLPVFVLMFATPFVIRTQIIYDLGLEANGIYQAVFALSSQCISTPIAAVLTYTLPKITQLDDPRKIGPDMNNAIRVSVLLSTFAILVLLLARVFFIKALYSSKFLPAVTLIPWQMVGDSFRSIAMTVQLPLMPQERFRARNIQHILQYALYLTVFYLTPPAQRLMGVVHAHAVSWAFAAITTYGYVNWLNGFRFDARNWRLILTSTAAVSFTAFMPFSGPKWQLAGVGIAVAWLVTAVSRNDCRQLAAAVRSRLSKPG